MLIFLLGLESLGNHLKINTQQFSQGVLEMGKTDSYMTALCMTEAVCLGGIQCLKCMEFLPPRSLHSSEESLTKNNPKRNKEIS